MQNISTDKKDVQTLIKLGLNGSQARTYLTLISLGVATAKEVSRIAKIDRGEIYRQLVQLHNKNMVEKIIEFPNKYRALPLKGTLEMLMEKKIKNTSKQQEV